MTVTNVTSLLDQTKLHARIIGDDEDASLLAMLVAAAEDVAHAANIILPATAAELPEDLRFAVIDQTAMLYDARGGVTTKDRPLGLSLAASRIVARYRGVKLGVQP